MVHHSAMHKPDLPTRRLLLIALCLTGAHSQAQGAALQVAAASSLAGVMPELARGFESQHGGTRLEWRAKGSGLLLDGMAQGQATDLLLASDGDTITRGVQRKLLRAESVRAFAGNSLVLLVPAASRLPIQRLTDLGRSEVQRVAVARPTSAPAGRYARQAIDAARMWPSVQRKIVLADSARGALDLLLRDEADAALVYLSDGLSAGTAVREVAVLTGHEPIRLTAAVAQTSRQPEAAARFIQHLRGEAARVVLVGAGFSVL